MERENRMQGSNREGKALTPEESWSAIQATMDKARTSMYLAGFSAILLLWGPITALGYLVEYGLQTWGVDFLGRNPWIRAPLWGSLMVGGMVGSSIIGRRAAKRNVDGNAARSTGIRVFLFWIAVTLAAFFIPGAAGMWTVEAGQYIPPVSIGIVMLGYILFGIMTRPALAAVGVGIAASYFLPSHLAGDAALAVSAVATLLVVALGTVWIRRSGVA